MSCVVKRKRDAEAKRKKPKTAFGEKERELLSSQNDEWPMYYHPDGGTVKITPWGSLRQCVDASTGEATTRFEDVSFQDVSFEMSPSNAHNQYYELPSTPMSLNNVSASGQSSPAPGVRFNFSPSNEAELYVEESYGQQNANSLSFTQEYVQEQEHYLGMEESGDHDNGVA